jgi:hypothetical protein
MPPVGFKPQFQQVIGHTLALDRSDTVIGGIRSPDRPARIESLYQLRYSGPPYTLTQFKKKSECWVGIT